MKFIIKAAAAAAIAAILSASEVSAVTTHPRLLTDPAGIQLARERLKTEPWAPPVLEALKKEARALGSEELPVFEKAWWGEASKKRWQDTYPEINHHTMFAVCGPALRSADAALLYALTGKPEDAALARRVLLHYTGYEFFAKHPDVGLNWSIWCLRLLHAYDIVYDTLSDADRAKIDDFFERAMEAVKENDEWWVENNPGGMFNNHFAWHKLFIGSRGLLYGRPELVDYAMESNQGIRELIENGARDDGLWFESSLNYHFTAVDAISEFARELRNAGSTIDLWNRRFANGRSLRGLLTAPIGPLFPDETLPTIGDCYGRRMKLEQVKWYWAAYDAYRLPEIAWILRNVKQPPAEALFLEHLPVSPAAPAMATRIWPEHGYIALRTQEGTDYWRGDGFSVFLSFDLNSIHSHADKFDLMAYARGAHIAVDPEALSTAQHAFSSRIQSELNRATVCHNTLMVDGRSHAGTGQKLELVGFVNEPGLKIATIADTQGTIYPGVKLSRTVAATPEYVLDIFQAASEEEHVYDYLFHGVDDDGRFSGDGEFTPAEFPSQPPWNWLRNARERSVDETWTVTAKQDDLTSHLTMVGCPRTTLTLCEFPRKDTFEKPSVPMLIARREANSTVFVSVLQAERGTPPPVSISVRDDRHNLIRIAVGVSGSVREFSVRGL